MNVPVTVTFLKGKAEVSTFTFICKQELELGAGVDAAVAFLRRRHPKISLLDTSMHINFERAPSILTPPPSAAPRPSD